LSRDDATPSAVATAQSRRCRANPALSLEGAVRTQPLRTNIGPNASA
jgi:hypothetical protein